MNTSSSPRGWHSRGYLPHFDGGEELQFITLRLADSLPKKVIEKWKVELRYEPDDFARDILSGRIETYIDQGYGRCWLRRKNIAKIVEDNLKRFDGIRYDLYSWVVMPNHTHFIIRPAKGYQLSEILKNHKSYSSHKANECLGRTGQFWQEDYFDREIRDLGDFIDKLNYIDMNPVRAKLCKKPQEWRFSSAKLGRRFQL